MAEHPHLKASELFTCKGFTAVVTGGGTGIGLMQTLALVENGAKVFIVSRNEEKLRDVAQKYGGKGSDGRGEIIPVPGIVTTKADLSKIVVESRNKRQTAFTSCSTTQEWPERGLGKVQGAAEEWARILNVNVIGYYFTAAAFLPLLQKGGKSTKGYASQIINVSSISGLMKGSSGGQYANAASKEAIVQLSKVMAREFLPLKIRVNQIAPGIFPSEMTAGDSDPNTHKSSIEGKGQGLPSGRPGDEKDMAAATLYLASHTGVFTNGQILHPDGGATVQTPSSL
ncbi:hypothetical protein JCM24511_08406 [Saitozyma sp. JCM 24511]|nr:hypothetical protein JCM24511_08406 [Saitozyma sp. JCM 24511]